jgi:hypothetical protein
MHRNSIAIVSTILFFLAAYFYPAFAAQYYALPIEDSTRLVRRFIYEQHPGLPLTHQFPLKEFTTPETWQRLHIQIYKVRPDADALKGETYLLKNATQVIPIGKTAGGEGVNSLCVADILGDGLPELFYTYSTGESSPRTFLGIYSPFSRPGTVAIALSNFVFNGQMRLLKQSDQLLYLVTGPAEKPALLASILPEKRGGRTQMSIQLNPRLLRDAAGNAQIPANKRDVKKSPQKEKEKTQLRPPDSAVR